MEGADTGARRGVRRIAGRAALWGAVAGVIYLAILDRRVVDGFSAQRWRHPIAVYAAPRSIYVGLDVDRSEIAGELTALGYRPVAGPPKEPGTYRSAKQSLTIFLNPSPLAGRFATRPATLVKIKLEAGRVRKIALPLRGGFGHERGGVDFADEITLEPRLLPGVFDGPWTGRTPLRIEDVPRHVVDAVLAAEDVRFLAHAGIDPSALVRAFKVNWEAQAVRQGGSTITQQVVKNYFLNQRRTFTRKLREAFMALALEWHFSKREILECYLATVYLGHDRLLAVEGLAEGARVYFGKTLDQVTLGEAATLAGMIRAPNLYSPLRHRARATARRDQVLAQMEGLGWIGEKEASAARGERLVAPPRRPPPSEAYFMQQVRRELESLSVAPESLAHGSAVFTTLDPRLQAIVSDSIERFARDVDRGPTQRHGGQVAVVALDPETGAIRALAGGRDFLRSQLDRATQIERPVGSLFKPFVYLAAVADPGERITASTLILDEPLTVKRDGVSWSPRNYDERYRGPVTLRFALEHSLNVPTVQLVETLGIEPVARFGDRLGLLAPGELLPRLPALALGAFPSSLLRVTAAYTVFPRGGSRVTPFAVASVKAPSGVMLRKVESSATEVAPRAPVYVIHSILQGVTTHGTARRIREAGLGGPLAGKTGTTNDYRDAWFVGYTPSLVVGVWVGFDDDRPLRASAAEVAVPLWIAIMKHALAGVPLRALPVPPNVELVSVEAATGRRAGPGCGASISEAFVAGTAPTGACVPGRPQREPPEADEPAEVTVEQMRSLVLDLLHAVPEALSSVLGLGKQLGGEKPPSN
jgi:penicillin-binding protein 1B